MYRLAISGKHVTHLLRDMRNISGKEYAMPSSQFTWDDVCEDGALYTVNSVEKVDDGGKVYDMMVAGDHSFIANGVAVHNCKDFLYRFEVANHKVGAAKIIFSNGEDPVKTNPSERPGLCKHLLALGGYVGGMRFRESMDDIDRAVFAQRLEEALTAAS